MKRNFFVLFVLFGLSLVSLKACLADTTILYLIQGAHPEFYPNTANANGIVVIRGHGYDSCSQVSAIDAYDLYYGSTSPSAGNIVTYTQWLTGALDLTKTEKNVFFSLYWRNRSGAGVPAWSEIEAQITLELIIRLHLRLKF